MCSIGIALGLSIHIIYSAFGLAAIIANSEMALWGIKLIGGGYLFYLGYKGLKARPSNLSEQCNTPKIIKYSDRKSIAVGFLCNALNPKAPIYFVSLFTIVLSPNMPLYQIAIYGLWMMFLQLFWFSLVVIFLSRPKINEKFTKMGHWVDRVFGGAMIVLGIKVISSKIN